MNTKYMQAPPRRFGLGDLAYYAFRPVVWMVDSVCGTDLHSCEKCAERRKRWNKKLSVPLWLALLGVTMAGALIVWRSAK